MNEKIISYVDPASLVVTTNSRWRVDQGLEELMESIKQHGILQPITARAEDRAVICGNRRLGASIKLGLSFVPVIFMEKIDDKTLELLNLMENMQRKDISSIEIGRQCDMMLKNTKFRISIAEIATSIGVTENRIKICLDIFLHLPAIYRDKVVSLYISRDRKIGDLPENIVFAILNFSRQFKSLNKDEMDLLLRNAGEKKLTIHQIYLIGQLFSSGMPLKKVLKEIDYYHVSQVKFITLKTEFASVQKKEGVTGREALFNKIVKKVYPNLVY